MEKLTPMMQQYLKVKEEHKDCILFFRLGDFYEMFFDDALEASKILEIALTGKSCGLKERAPMCGIPYHSSESYIQKLIEAGKKIAICEQVEDPKTSKGIVKREVVRIVTPGTYIDEKQIGRFRNNYILSVFLDDKKKRFAAAYIDVSTGELNLSLVDPFDFQDMLYRISPLEIVANRSFLRFINEKERMASQLRSFIQTKNICMNLCKEDEEKFERHFFSKEYIEEFKLYEEEHSSLLSAVRGLLSYIEFTQKVVAENINTLRWIRQDRYLKMDYHSIVNLELLESSISKNRKYSLYGVLNHTKTAMGSRLLRRWIEHPLRKKEEIEFRLNLVEECVCDFALREDLILLLENVYDMERICAKLSYDTVTVRDLLNLKESLSSLPELLNKIFSSKKEALCSSFETMDDLQDIYRILEETIDDNAGGTMREGMILREGYHTLLDELRSMEKNSARLLSELEMKERGKTGIKTLKVGYNKVFGYYIEITHAAIRNAQIPSDYIRKQTLANAERYINEELKELEEKILTSRQKAMDLQFELYRRIREKITTHIFRIQKTANHIALLDVILSLAKVASEYNYTRPSLNQNKTLNICDGRHPVVEKLAENGIFVPNDTYLNEEQGFMIITGPNMGGKSTYMRQVALISLMAHMGSFVPAKHAEIPLFDAIFTRVGASDDLSRGQSTFMVEMNEVSYILSQATKQSLVILDEVGRGTSTYDGMSIAWSIIAHLCEKIGSLSLFSTHYHEITEIENEYSGIVNYCVAVNETKEEVVFLRKVIKGKADKSYGIHVARLAHLPEEVILSSEKKLEELQNRHLISQNAEMTESVKEVFIPVSSAAEESLIQELKDLSIETMTPIEAMMLLMRWKESVK